MQTQAYPTPYAARLAARSGELDVPTANIAPGFVQANLAILPRDLAYDFLLFCQRNPKPCPLVGVSEVGDPKLPLLGHDLDIRTDVPRYRVWEKGQVVAEVTDITPYWRDDLVTFAIGCSFSFEEAMLAAGLPVRHIEQCCNVPMYRTGIATTPAGRFSGPLVMSMRPLSPKDAIRAAQVTARFPSVHGGPLHIGDPSLVGIKDIHKPDYGDAVHIRSGEIPVFWACGVTPQSVIAASMPDFCITHAPGYMLLTDIPNADLAVC
ncbi:putative hydro-lyase [Aquabacter sediminis]|uniref:putative hydro-lyase n=1 Tax=Aquabacter sediminis TaxID=3029197 RepID=UPI00237D674F|nr:putative hydro-lyase [Aquabacter sp. P-9]MDE1570203.1 putative hydro-lyase [Aquabacter sp. P-9]